MGHKEVQPAGWSVFVWMKSSIVGCGVSLCLALSLIRTYLNTSGSSGPRCPNYRRLLYFKHWAWLILSAVFMMALSLLDDRVLDGDNLDPHGIITLGGSEEEDSPQWNVSVLLGSYLAAGCWAQITKQLLQTTKLWMWPKSHSERKEPFQLFLVGIKPFLSFEALGAGLAHHSGNIPLLQFLVTLYEVKAPNLSQ